MNPVDHVEKARLKIQGELDYANTQLRRNKLGQFATPSGLALDIAMYAKRLLREKMGIRFLDPAFGTGSFYSAILQAFDSSQIGSAAGYEIDDRYATEARRIWLGSAVKIHTRDFTSIDPPVLEEEKANLIICNPPYVRHHHLSSSEKIRLRDRVAQVTGVKMSGLAGLYCYYMGLTHNWMAKDCIAAWLIPSEFMYVNYGVGVKKYLLERVTLLRIHRFNPENVQFTDADVSSAVVWFKNRPPPQNHSVAFTEGAKHQKPSDTHRIPLSSLESTMKWMSGQFSNKIAPGGASMKLSDLFEIKRGLATGANEFFILDDEKVSSHNIPPQFLIPILPMPRSLELDEIRGDADGNPLLRQKPYLLNCALSQEDVRKKFPSLWEYLRIGLELGVDQRYLCRHRKPWYSQEERPPAPFLCSYFGRKSERRDKPFRFILNRSKATASNSYLMLYPRGELKMSLDSDPSLYQKVWESLKQITSDDLVSHGRVYGGGLHKLEPKELASVPADNLVQSLPMCNLPFQE